MMTENDLKLKIAISVFAGIGTFIMTGFVMLPGFIEAPLYRYLAALGIGVVFGGMIFMGWGASGTGGGGDDGGFDGGGGE